ncbi:protein-disulfide reductase DsbD [Pasteurellaceae bacterium 22721_9_1]
MKKYIVGFLLFCTALLAQAGIFDKKPQFLKPDQAFAFSASVQQQSLALHWDIADGYYLYKKEITVEPENVKFGDPIFPPAEQYEDEFFGNVDIFRDDLTVNVPLLEMAKSSKVIVNYQGCTKGFCYPPEQKVVDLAMIGAQSAVQNDALFQQKIASDNLLLSEQDQLAQRLSQSSYSVLWFFVLGLGLAFTPCVLPMLPLLSAIVIGSGQRPNTLRAFSLSFVYVQGMALTYTLLGLIVAMIGLPFQVALQSPYVLIGLSILFVLLALSMFGVFTLQLPSRLQTKLAQYSQQQKSGAFGGVFVMGMIAGLVASPCTSAPLSGALLYVAQSGDLFTGAITLYLLALGMGLPLMLVTIFGNKILPKSGQWMNTVKNLFGFVLLLLPVFLLARVFPNFEAQIKATWLASIIVWICFQLGRSWQGWLIVTGLACAMFFFKAPIQHWVSGESAVQNGEVSVHLQRVTSYDELQLALANNPKSIAMLDLYADWCVACKEFEKYTFPDAKVQHAFENILLLQVDMTKNSDKNRELMDKLAVIGLPTMIFFDKQGNEIEGARVTGFMQAQPFTDWLNQLLK